MYLSISEVTKKKEKQNENVTVFINQKKKRKEKYYITYTGILTATQSSGTLNL